MRRLLGAVLIGLPLAAIFGLAVAETGLGGALITFGIAAALTSMIWVGATLLMDNRG